MSSDSANSLVRLDEFAWIRSRVLGGKVAPSLARVLGDGDYLSAWRTVGALILPIAFAIGLWSGRYHFAYDPPERPIVLYSLPTMVVLIILSQHGAAVGFSTWLGWCLGDLWRNFHLAGKDPETLKLLGVTSVAAASLWILMVGTPMTARALGRAITGRFKPQKRTTVKAAVTHGLLLFLLVYMWCQSSPPLFQPVYIWQGMTPMTHGLVQAMHKTGWALAAVAAYAGAMRVAFETAAEGQEAFRLKRSLMQQAAAAVKEPGVARTLLGTVLKAAFITFMMASYINSWALAFLAFAALSAALIFRVVVLGYMGFGKPITRIPILVRLPLSILLVFVVSTVAMKLYWDKGGFLLPLWSTVISIVIGAILLPPQPPEKKGAGAAA